MWKERNRFLFMLTNGILTVTTHIMLSITPPVPLSWQLNLICGDDEKWCNAGSAAPFFLTGERSTIMECKQSSSTEQIHSFWQDTGKQALCVSTPSSLVCPLHRNQSHNNGASVPSLPCCHDNNRLRSADGNKRAEFVIPVWGRRARVTGLRVAEAQLPSQPPQQEPLTS